MLHYTHTVFDIKEGEDNREFEVNCIDEGTSEDIIQKNKGTSSAIKNKGMQDHYMESKGDCLFDVCKTILDDSCYQAPYQKIPTFIEWKNNRTIVNIIPNDISDLINHLDLMFNKEININETIKSIEVTYGGQRFDILEVSDLETQIKTLCKLFNRTMNIINNKTFIPLIMAPFYDNNLVFPKTKFHNIIIKITFYHPQIDTNIELYGYTYFLNRDKIDSIIEDGYEMITTQNQYLGPQKINQGINEYNLFFNHPMYLIYLWGFDKTKVKNITIKFNDFDYYNGPIEVLQNLQWTKGHKYIEPLIIYFSQDLVGTKTRSSVNFSRLDKAKIIIDTEEQKPSTIHIVGINIQVVKSINHMYGLVFSK